MRLAALLSLLLVGGCFEARAETFDSLPSPGASGGVGGYEGMGVESLTRGGVSPTFYLSFADGSGLSALSDAPVVNGTTLTLVCSFVASDRDGDSWPGTGATLALTGSGTSPETMAAPLTNTTDRAIGKFRSGNKVFQTSSASDCDTTTEDLIIEVVGATPAVATTGTFVAKWQTSFGGGWVLLAEAGNVLTMGYTASGGGATATKWTFTYSPSPTWFHLITALDVSATNGAQAANAWINGSAVSHATSGSAPSGQSQTSTDRVTIGSYSAGGTGPLEDGAVALVNVYKCSGCMPGGASNASALTTVAAERFARLTGTRADVAAGSALPTFTRASVASADIARDDDGVRRLFTVGNGWPRVVKRPYAGDVLRTGYLSDPQATNLALQSAAFGTTWSKIDAGDTITDGSADPRGTSTADAIIADSTDGEHGVTQAITVTATGYTFSVWAKAGTQGHLYVGNDTVANAYSYFDLDPCAVGTNGAGASGEAAEDYGNGWCRVSITYTGTAASHTHRIGCAAADADNTFSGDGAATSCTLWGAQVEAQPVATSYIATTTASATRNADDLRFTATDNAVASEGTHEVCAVLPDHDAPAETVLSWVGATGADTNSVSLRQTSGDAPYTEGQSAASAQWQITGTGDVSDGDEHCTYVAYATDDVELFFDGATTGTPDTSATMPSSFTSIFVGESRSLGSQPRGVITRLRIYDEVTTP